MSDQKYEDCTIRTVKLNYPHPHPTREQIPNSTIVGNNKLQIQKACGHVLFYSVSKI